MQTVQAERNRLPFSRSPLHDDSRFRSERIDAIGSFSVNALNYGTRSARPGRRINSLFPFSRSFNQIGMEEVDLN